MISSEKALYLYEQLRIRSNWLILSHHKPDGDTLGSSSALYQVGRSLKKKTIWGGEDPYPEIYTFLSGSDDYLQLRGFPSSLSTKETAIICLDISNIERSIPCLSEDREDSLLVNIDHHADNEAYGDINIISPDSSSTGEILWSLFNAWDISISPGIATAIYTAIMTDTGNFAYQNTRAETLAFASEAIRSGAIPSEIYRLVYHNQTLEGLRLWGQAFSRTEEVCPHVLLSWLSREDFARTGATGAETENLVNRLMDLRGVLFAALLVEEEQHVRISLRSRNPVLSARDVAVEFGGGGHPQAAGCRLTQSLPEACMIIRSRIMASFDPQ